MNSKEIRDSFDEICKYSDYLSVTKKSPDVKDAIEILKKYAFILNLDNKEKTYIICA